MPYDFFNGYLTEDTSNSFPYTFNNLDKDTKIFLNANGDKKTVQDLLHYSYVNDTQVLYRQLNETQGIISDIWQFKIDKSIIDGNGTNEYYVKQEDGSTIFNWKQVLLKNNILSEQKISTSEYEKKEGKIIWKELTYQQGVSQLESVIQLVYVYNDEFNDYRLTQGDIVKDPLNPDTFLVISKQEEQKQFHDKIGRRTLYILNVFQTRLNLSILPNEIYSYYYNNESKINDIKNDNKEVNGIDIIDVIEDNSKSEDEIIIDNEDEDDDKFYEPETDTSDFSSVFDDWIEKQL